jgi:penicillin-binding protein 2A
VADGFLLYNSKEALNQMKYFPEFKEIWQSLRQKTISQATSLKESRFWKKPKFWMRLGILLSFSFLLILSSIAIWISSLDISKLQSPLAQPTFIYDRNGIKISELSSSKIEPITLDKIPNYMQKGIVAVEDKRFYEHQGIDLWAILRALVRDLKTQDFSEGGSTITQQLAKNHFLTLDKTVSRKLKEAGYAIKIEIALNKDQILEAYLNNIYFGEGRWGIQEAARYYFGKNADKLNLEESALLAGILKAPSIYSPITNKEKALERRNLVLSLMKDQGFILLTEYENARTAPIVLRKGALNDLSGKYAPYVDYVIEEAITRYGFTQDQILTGGLQIYTEMDTNVQKAAEDVYKDDKYFPTGKPDQIVQSGIVLIDQYSGGIRGLVGYRGESAFRQFNHATQLKRQPGSTLKPLSVYGAALEKGYRPNTRLYDAPLTINGYSPKDWDNQTRGWVTMEEAIENSWNIPAVWLLNEMGIDIGKSFAQKAKIPLSDKDNNLSIALGGLSEGVSPLNMAQAYSAFANQGKMNTAHAINKITSSSGYLFVQAKPEFVQLMNPHNAYTMTLLLQNVVKNGTAKNAAFGSRPVAGKTGSVELPPSAEFSGISKGQKDVWYVGYTPELTAAVWMGYDKTDRNHYLTSSGGSGPAIVFREVLSRSLINTPIKPFTVPAGYKMDWKEEERLKEPASQKENNNSTGRSGSILEELLNRFKGKGKNKN